MEEQNNPIGTVRTVEIQEEMRSSYLDYAMSVIVARALPDARDGMKPVHRRILYAMHDMGLRHNTPYKKSARIVGEVLGKYHPHGDSAVYDAMVRMAQDFSLRYMLVDGQGNFGSIDGDSAAAMRYTEARLAPISAEMLTDIEKNTVDFVDNFDGSLQEPSALPARLPNLLLNGASGIAVGMSTNIPPHNLSELVDAIVYMIDHYDRVREITVDELMQFVKGPDFPTGGIIAGLDGIKEAYATGRNPIVVRARTEIEEIKGGKFRIIVTEIPYQVNKTLILEKIAELVRSGRIDMISDLRDESDRNGLRINIELKRNAQPMKVLNRLLKYTPLQSTFGIQLLALVDNEPRTLSLRRALQIYIEHRVDVITRRTEYDLAKARARAHILEGYLIALANLDDIIDLIRNSPDVGTAREQLMIRYSLSEAQAQAILDLQLRRLAALERQKIEDEHKTITDEIARLETLLADPDRILGLIREDLLEIREKYGDERRTFIDPTLSRNFDETDLITEEEVLISISEKGYIKRVPAKAYRAQSRGGKGVKGFRTGEEDEVAHIFAAGSLDSVLLFTDKGKVYSERAYEIPAADRAGKGVLIQSIMGLEMDENITATMDVPTFEEDAYLLMATQQGKIKRTPLSAFASVHSNGKIAIRLAEGDVLGWVKVTYGDSDVIIVTEGGQCIRFEEEQVRVMGRTARGSNALKLYNGDRVAGVDTIEPDEFDSTELLIVTAKGYGKRTPVSEFHTQNRYGRGVVNLNRRRMEKTGRIVGARVVHAHAEDLTLISVNGVALRTDVNSISIYNRVASGVRLMDLAPDDEVASIALIESPETRRKKAHKKSTSGNGQGSPEEKAMLEEDIDAFDEEMGDVYDDEDAAEAE